eukprot:Lankesteria_metandrocarpae@DN3317_c0_g1_i1.p2
MAQIPWEVVNSVQVSAAEAARFTAKCCRELHRKPRGLPVAQNTVPSCLSALQHVTSEFSVIDTGCYYRVTARGTVLLHPCWLNAADYGARMYISNFLLKYLPEFNGIWIAFQKIEPLDEAGHIADSEMWVIASFAVEVECLVFKPEKDSCIIGRVTQVRQNHIGLLTCGVFNACVRRRAGLHERFELIDGEYRCKESKMQSIVVGAWIRFRVVGYQYSSSGDISTIEGSLMDTESTGVVCGESGELLNCEGVAVQDAV